MFWAELLWMVKNKKTTSLLVFSRILKQLRMNAVKTTTRPTLDWFFCRGGGTKWVACERRMLSCQPLITKAVFTTSRWAFFFYHHRSFWETTHHTGVDLTVKLHAQWLMTRHSHGEEYLTLSSFFTLLAIIIYKVISMFYSVTLKTSDWCQHKSAYWGHGDWERRSGESLCS